MASKGQCWTCGSRRTPTVVALAALRNKEVQAALPALLKAGLIVAAGQCPDCHAQFVVISEPKRPQRGRFRIISAEHGG